MDENYLEKILDNYYYNIQDYKINDYNINNNHYNDYKNNIKEIIQTAIEKQITISRNSYKFSNPLSQTDEEKLEAMDISVIEKFLRKKKLQKLSESTK